MPALTILFCIGILAGAEFPGHCWMALLVSLICLVHIAICAARLKPAAVAPLLLFFALGTLSIQPWVPVQFPKHHVSHFTDRGKARITGIVAAPPWYSGRRLRFPVDVERLRIAGKTVESAGRIRVTVPDAVTAPASGDRVIFTARLRSFRNFGNPGGFDYQRYMLLKGIHASATAGAGRLKISPNAEGNGLHLPFQRLRKSLSRQISQAAEPRSAAVLNALILGDRDGISADLRQAFARAGIGHLLAISGLHVGVAASWFFLLFRFITVRFRWLLVRGSARKAAALLTTVPVIAYGLISGMAPSTQRAVIMVIAFLLAIVIERETDAASSIALAAFAILLIDPSSIYSVSFQLSFAAVIAIFASLSVKGAGRGGIVVGESRIKKCWRWCRQFFRISVFAILGTLPLTMIYFHQTSLLGLAANFLFVPLLGFVAVPAGMASAAIMVAHPGTGMTAMGLLSGYVDVCLNGVDLMAGLPFAAVQTVIPDTLTVICYYFIGGAIWFLIKTASDGGVRTNQMSASVNWIPGGQLAWCILVVACTIVAGDTAYWGWQRFFRTDLRLTALDVGQGTCILAEMPRGKTMLVDGGGFSDNTVFDIGEAVVAPALLRKKIRTVDRILLSHPNSDHLNGLLYILENFRVGEVWSNGESANTLGYRRFKELIEKRQIVHRLVNAGIPPISINGVHVSVLHPQPDVSLSSEGNAGQSNDHSVVLRIDYGDLSFLLPGDIMAQAEGTLVDVSSGRLSADVLFAPHHGSRSSSSLAFLETVHPDWGVFSVGFGNRFHFPHAEVLSRYEKMGVRIFRTDRDGAVTFTTDGDGLSVSRFRADGGMSWMKPQASAPHRYR